VALPQARRGDLGATCARQSSPQVRRALPQEPDGSTCRGLRPSAPRRGALVRGHTGRTQWHPPCGALAHDHLFATRSSGQPVEPPAQHLDLLRHTVPYLCLWARRLGFPDTVGVVYASTEMAEPRRDLTGRVILKRLMEATTAQPRRCGNLSDRNHGLVGGHDRPAPFLVCVGQPHGGRAEPCPNELCTTDTLSQGLAGFHFVQDRGCVLICPANWMRWRTFLLRLFRRAKGETSPLLATDWAITWHSPTVIALAKLEISLVQGKHIACKPRLSIVEPRPKRLRQQSS
jgi:hypothetical protein